jgi:hypothetical protein
VLLHYGIRVPLAKSIEKPRWSFWFVDWESFAADIDNVVRFIPACSDSYERFSNAIRAAAKRHVPRDYRKVIIDYYCENLYQEYNTKHDRATANRLLEELNDIRKRKWEKTVRISSILVEKRGVCFGNLVPILQSFDGSKSRTIDEENFTSET